jgi:hypothetical protein
MTVPNSIPPNPYRRGSYEAQYYDHRVREIESARDRADIWAGNAPETQTMNKLWTEAMVGQVEPDHGHIGVNARILLQQREAMAARIAEQRGELREPDPEPEWRQIYVAHPEAGVLRLRTDGNCWVVRIRGTDIACGTVTRSELDVGLKPSQAVVQAAARCALSDPWGPEAPAGSPIFRGGPDGEPVELTINDLNAAEPNPEPSVIERIRRRIAERKDHQ